MTWLDIAGGGAAVAGTLAFMPQAARVIRADNTKSISLLTAFIFWVSIILWIVHGYGIGSMPLLLCNAVAFLPNSIILFMKARNGLRYGER